MLRLILMNECKSIISKKSPFLFICFSNRNCKKGSLFFRNSTKSQIKLLLKFKMFLKQPDCFLINAFGIVILQFFQCIDYTRNISKLID